MLRAATMDLHKASRLEQASKPSAKIETPAAVSNLPEIMVQAAGRQPLAVMIGMLLEMPLGLRNLMYLEGGGPAQLCVRAGGAAIDLTGCYDVDGPAGGEEALPSPIPNVIGVARLAVPGR